MRCCKGFFYAGERTVNALRYLLGWYKERSSIDENKSTGCNNLLRAFSIQYSAWTGTSRPKEDRLPTRRIEIRIKMFMAGKA